MCLNWFFLTFYIFKYVVFFSHVPNVFVSVFFSFHRFVIRMRLMCGSLMFWCLYLNYFCSCEFDPISWCRSDRKIFFAMKKISFLHFVACKFVLIVRPRRKHFVHVSVRSHCFDFLMSTMKFVVGKKRQLWMSGSQPSNVGKNNVGSKEFRMTNTGIQLDVRHFVYTITGTATKEHSK